MDVTQLPNDPAALKALLLEKHQQLATLEARAQQLEQDKARLEQRLAQALQRFYGRRAQQVAPGQLLLEFLQQLDARPLEAPATPGTSAPAPVSRGVTLQRRGGQRRNLAQDAAHLREIPLRHELPEGERRCPCCGEVRQPIGEESTYQLERIPAEFVKIKHIQVRYACRACEQQAENPRIELAPKPYQPIDKGLPGPGLLAFVVVSKYADYLPLYRLEQIFDRQGVQIARSTMCQWAGDVADLTRPVYELMVQRVLQSHVIGTDDTVLPVLLPGQDQAQSGRIWIYRGDEAHPYNVFDFTLSRRRDGPALFLQHYTGVLLADAYGGYDGICLAGGMTKAGCWAHGRRKFADCWESDPTFCQEIIERINALFALERQGRELDAAGRLALRQNQSQPLVEALRQRLWDAQEQRLPKDPVRQAVGYMLHQWETLIVFLRDPAVAMDNNLAEQQMKRIAIARKNFLFAGSERGAQTAAVLSSLTSTCQRLGVNPELYLTQLLVNLPGTPLTQVDQWLPDAWQKRQTDLPITISQ